MARAFYWRFALLTEICYRAWVNLEELTATFLGKENGQENSTVGAGCCFCFGHSFRGASLRHGQGKKTYYGDK
jgi:hypothetical protein